MKNTYIILEENRILHSEHAMPDRRAFAAKSLSKKLKLNAKLTFKDFTSDNAMQFKKRNTPLAIAPSVPVKLIKPLSLKISKRSTQNKSNWGLDELGLNGTRYTGKGVTVAILDSGIDENHLAFKGIKIIQKDFTGEGDGDRNGHGTHCAGIIVGRPINDIKIGVAQGVSKLLVGKILDKNGNGSTKAAIEGLKWATENGANVISMSIGIDFPKWVRQMEQRGIESEAAISIALEDYRNTISLFEACISQFNQSSISGMIEPSIVIAAAGNESKRKEVKSYVVSVSAPASSNGIISVGAIEKTADGYEIASFSNAGAMIFAPGVNISSAKIKGNYYVDSGTSMAAPHVAGIAALWIEKLKEDNQFNIRDIFSRIISSGKRSGFSKNNKKEEIQNGIIQAPQ